MNTITVYSHQSHGNKWDILSPTGEVLCQVPSAEDADSLVSHLNKPMPGSMEAEYIISSGGFWFQGMREEARMGVTLIDPNRVHVANIDNEKNGWKLLEHLNREV